METKVEAKTVARCYQTDLRQWSYEAKDELSIRYEAKFKCKFDAASVVVSNFTIESDYPIFEVGKDYIMTLSEKEGV